MVQVSEVVRGWLGWCPHAPALRTAPSILVVPSFTVNPAEPGSGGAVGGSGRIRQGIGIATGSIRALARDKRLLWFSFLTGLVIIFLVAAEAWIVAWTVAESGSATPFLVSVPFMDASLVFDTRIFLLQAVCLSCFNLILAGLVLYRSRENSGRTPVRDAFAAVNPRAGTLAALSVVMALAGTLIDVLASQTQLIGKLVAGIDMAVFYLPYAYYVPDVLSSALFFSAIIMAVTILGFLLALYVVPGIVLEDRTLLSALAGSVALMKTTWREIVGCILVFGAIIAVAAAIALAIGQSPLLLSHDYDFFLQISRGQVLMTAVCYGFLLACGVLAAAGSTIMGIAVTELYACGTTGGTRENLDTTSSVGAEPAR